LETELGEALNDKEIYLKSDRGTQLVNPEVVCITKNVEQA
jgi:hypothetical protein